MDYNYIRLENLIKQALNKNYVAISSKAQTSEEISNGGLTLNIDTILKQFIFKANVNSENIIVDPINRKLLNVAYINDVDISKLVNNITAGYAINIVNKGVGTYEINVIKDIFALSEELELTNNRVTTLENNPLIYKYEQAVNDESVGEILWDYLINTKKKENGIIFANPVNLTYSYVIFQTLKNSGFAFRVYNAVDPVIKFKGYGLYNNTNTPYEGQWRELALKESHYTKAQSDDRYILVNPNMQATRSQTINSMLYINFPEEYDNFLNLVKILHPNIKENNYVDICVGKSTSADECIYLYYKEKGVGGLGVSGTPNIIEFTKALITLNKVTTINDNLIVNSSLKVKSWVDILNPNMANNDVNRISIGKLSSDYCSAYLGYKEPGIGYLGLFKDALIVTFTKDLISLNKATKITGNLTVTGAINNYYNCEEVDQLLTDNNFFYYKSPTTICFNDPTSLLKGKFIAEELYFGNSLQRIVNDIALTNESSNSNNTLATTAFCHENFVTKPPNIKIIEERTVVLNNPIEGIFLIQANYGNYFVIEGIYKDDNSNFKYEGVVGVKDSQESYIVQTNDNPPKELTFEYRGNGLISILPVTDITFCAILIREEPDTYAPNSQFVNLKARVDSKLDKIDDIYTKKECNDKYALTTTMNNLISTCLSKNGDQNLKGTLTINDYFYFAASSKECKIANLMLDCQIILKEDEVEINKATTFLKDITVLGHLNSNFTITHYTKIEDVNNIKKYKVGVPVFMSGKVYKQINKITFVPSTEEDNVDCICSTKIEGLYKEYVGIITSLDIQNNCVTFASHGDYLFYVDNSEIYQIGDVVLYDGRILDEDYALTLKIQQSIVGKVTAKINLHFLAIFKD